MNRRLLIESLVAVILLAAFGSSLLADDEKTAAQLLPSSTVVYAELNAPKELLDTAWDHPIREKLESIEDVRKGLESDQFKQFRTVVGAIESTIDMKWREALEAITAGGVYMAIDSRTQGMAILAKGRDAETLKKIRETIVGLARQDAKNKGKPSPFEEKDYRGLTAYKTEGGVLAQLDKWLMVTNKPDLAKWIADAYLDGSDESLAANGNFNSARKAITDEPTVWAYADVKAMRDAGLAKELFREKSDNPAVEMLVGGVLATLRNTPFATAALNVEKETIRLTASIPHDRSWTGEAREYYFGPNGEGTAPPPLNPKNRLASIVTYRDVGEFWLAKEELFDEQVVAQLSQTDSQLSTFFSGLDFGQEVLSAARPKIQIVAVRQAFKGDQTPVPEIILPAGAIVFRLKEPEKVERRFKVAYKNFIALLNIGLGQQGQPQFDVETEKIVGGNIVSATYLPADTTKVGIQYNFSPTIGFVSGRFIIASTDKLARELIGLISKPNADVRKASENNTAAAVDLQRAHEILSANRKHFVAQNMLEKGHGKEAAEQEIGTLLGLLSLGKDAGLRLTADEKSMSLDVRLNFALSKE